MVCYFNWLYFIYFLIISSNSLDVLQLLMITGNFWLYTNVEHELLLTALVVGPVKINLTSLSTSDTTNFWNAFNDEIIFIGTCCIKFLSWVSNLNLSRSLLKNEDICWSLWPKTSSRNAFKSSISIVWKVSMLSFCWNLLRILLTTIPITW